MIRRLWHRPWRDEIRDAVRGAQLVGAAAGGMAIAGAAQSREPWPEPEAVAIHALAAHPGGRDQDLEDRTPGIGLRWRSASAGIYNNSWGAPSAYLTRRWRVVRGRHVGIDLDAGVATGYDAAPWSSGDVVPLVAATARWHRIAATYAPSPDGGAVLVSITIPIRD